MNWDFDHGRSSLSSNPYAKETLSFRTCYFSPSQNWRVFLFTRILSTFLYLVHSLFLKMKEKIGYLVSIVFFNQKSKVCFGSRCVDELVSVLRTRQSKSWRSIGLAALTNVWVEVQLFYPLLLDTFAFQLWIISLNTGLTPVGPHLEDQMVRFLRTSWSKF